jgi:hypothetical protein
MSYLIGPGLALAVRGGGSLSLWIGIGRSIPTVLIVIRHTDVLAGVLSRVRRT